MYKPRLTRPESGNKYYITKTKGGYSPAIEGKCKSTGRPDTACNVLANCVGYALGRFNEIGNYNSCRYLKPVNAENFIQNCGGLQVGTTPKLGACMVWQKGDTLKGTDGAGHVAIVEKIISTKEILVSQSGYNSNPFWTETIKYISNWNCSWMSKDYKFLGFIYNPAVKEDLPEGTQEIKITYSGKTYDCVGIVKNDTNYIRLRDFDTILNVLNVSWNGKTVEISKK